MKFRAKKSLKQSLKAAKEEGSIVTDMDLDRLANRWKVDREEVHDQARKIGLTIYREWKAKGRRRTPRTTKAQRKMIEDMVIFKALGEPMEDGTPVVSSYGALKRYRTVLMDYLADLRDGL